MALATSSGPRQDMLQPMMVYQTTALNKHRFVEPILAGDLFLNRHLRLQPGLLGLTEATFDIGMLALPLGDLILWTSIQGRIGQFGLDQPQRLGEFLDRHAGLLEVAL